MPKTLSASVKQRIEGAGLQLQAFRDVLPQGSGTPPTPPYCLVQEGIGLVPTADNPYDQSAAPVLRGEMVQVDLVQAWMDPVQLAAEPPVNRLAEDPTLLNRLIALLDGCVLAPFGTNDTRVWGCRVFGKAARQIERDNNIVRDSLTLLVERDTV